MVRFEMSEDLYDWDLVAEDLEFIWKSGDGRTARAEYNEEEEHWRFYYEGEDGTAEDTFDHKGHPTVEKLRVEVENFLLEN